MLFPAASAGFRSVLFFLDTFIVLQYPYFTVLFSNRILSFVPLSKENVCSIAVYFFAAPP